MEKEENKMEENPSETIRKIREFEQQGTINEEEHGTNNRVSKRKRDDTVRVGKRGVITIEILVIIAMLINIGMKAGEIKRKTEELPVVNSNIETVLIREEQPFQIGDYNFTIEQPRVLTDLNWGIDDTYEVVCVSYTSEPVGENDPYTFHKISSFIDMYILTTDGNYIKALSAYDVEKMLGSTQMQHFSNKNVGDRVYSREGYLFFPIRKGTADSIFIYITEGDPLKVQDKTLTQIYSIPVVEVDYIE